MKSLTRQHVWFALFVLAVFATGIGAGLAMARFMPPGPRSGRIGAPRPDRPPGPPDVVERMTRDLDLSAEQQRKLEVVFQNAGERFERFRSTSHDQFEALRRQLHDEIEQVLTEQQRARFRVLMPEPRGGPPPDDRGGPPPEPPAGPPPGPPGSPPPGPPR
jgi:hypothetical protein